MLLEQFKAHLGVAGQLAQRHEVEYFGSIPLDI
jgi:hypothetical protein